MEKLIYLFFILAPSICQAQGSENAIAAEVTAVFFTIGFFIFSLIMMVIMLFKKKVWLRVFVGITGALWLLIGSTKVVEDALGPNSKILIAVGIIMLLLSIIIKARKVEK